MDYLEQLRIKAEKATAIYEYENSKELLWNYMMGLKYPKVQWAVGCAESCQCEGKSVFIRLDYENALKHKNLNKVFEYTDKGMAENAEEREEEKEFYTWHKEMKKTLRKMVKTVKAAKVRYEESQKL